MDKKINKCGCGGELPVEVFEQHEQKAYCVMCRDCGCKGGTSINSNSAIALWNTAHPKISNAMQAVKWLEDGHKIVEIEENNYNAGTHFYEVDEDKNVICVDVENQSYDSTDNFFSQLLFSSIWQLYEAPKYKEITAYEALTDFALNGENKKIVLVSRGQEFYITRIENTIKFSSLSNPLGGMDKSREQLQGLQWRIYEN